MTAWHADEATRAAAREFHQERQKTDRLVMSQQTRAALSDSLVRLVNGDHPQAPSAAPWAAPRPIASVLPPVAKLEPDMLPSVLSAYVFDISERQQSPAEFVANACICGLGALAGNRARIRPKSLDDWEITPNFYGLNVGRPSSMKTPAQDAALGNIYELQDDLRTAWEREQREDGLDAAVAALSALDAKKKAAKAIKDGDRQAARNLLSPQSDVENEMPCPRLIVADSTFEKLGELLSENPRGLLLVRDELPGLLARLERNEFQSERAFYLEAFNGLSSFVFDRIGRGTIHIPRLTLSIIGGIQPSRAAPIVRSAVNGSGDDGLLQRLQLIAWPDDRTDWRWVDRSPSDVAREAYREALRRLHLLTWERADPLVYSFASGAQGLFREWYEGIQKEARAGDLSPALEAYVLKMPKTIAGLALIFHLVDGADGPVSAEATGRALDWSDYLRTHANRLYASGTVAVEEGARLIIKRRDALPAHFSCRDVQRKGWAGLVERQDVADAVDLLESTGHVRRLVSGTTPEGGRPSVAYEWHPTLAQGG